MTARSAGRIALTLALSTVAIAGCQAQQGDGNDAPSTVTPSAAASPGAATTESAIPSPTPTVAPASLTVTSSGDGKVIKPTDRVDLAVANGTLQTLTVTSERGAALDGRVVDGRWVSRQNMAPATTYTATGTALRSDGTPQKVTTSFRTLTPKTVATYHLLYDGQTVGVGAPVTIQFDSAVETKAMRAEIEKHAKVTTVPAVKGSWGWLDNRQLMWRPETFWKPGTKVSLSADLRGLQTGADKWVGRSGQASFLIGEATVSTVDIANHTMTVTRGGKVVRTVPISAGKSTNPSYVTRSGTKVIIEKAGDVTMDSETVGIGKDNPDYYKVDTKYNLRVTWTGEYLHSAPWSLAAQGNANVTHGCVNMAPDIAKWMFDLSKVGDVVKFTGSNREFKPTEGIGVWEYDYPAWTKQSARAA